MNRNKYRYWLLTLVIGFLVLAISCKGDKKEKSMPEMAATAELYTCPMHLEITSNTLVLAQ